MPGRKHPDMTEGEREREYRLMQKRSYGESVSGSELGEELEEKGAAAKVEKRREQWAAEHEGRSRQDF